MSPRLERVSPLPLSVAVMLPPLWPGETPLSGPVGLIVLVAVRIRLCRSENSIWENFSQLGGEEGLEAAACLSHLRVRLWSERKSSHNQFSAYEVLTDNYIYHWLHLLVIMRQSVVECIILTHIIKLCTVVEHEIDVSNKLVWRVIMSGTPLVEFGPDHRQIHRPLNDLVVMTSLCEKAAALRISWDQNNAATIVKGKWFKCNYLTTLSASKKLKKIK